MEARQEIEALIHEFAWRVDHGQIEAVAELFTEDGSFGNARVQLNGQEELGKGLAARAQNEATTRHVCSNIRLEVDSADRIRGWVTLTLYCHEGGGVGPPDPAAIAEYEDVYERGDDQRWRFAERRVAHVFARTVSD